MLTLGKLKKRQSIGFIAAQNAKNQLEKHISIYLVIKILGFLSTFVKIAINIIIFQKQNPKILNATIVQGQFLNPGISGKKIGKKPKLIYVWLVKKAKTQLKSQVGNL